MELQKRKSTRIPNFDYSRNNYYFITVCTHQKNCIFGSVARRNHFGKIAKDEIEKIPAFYKGVYLDSYIIMPNHIHAIIVLDGAEKSISEIIGSYKAGVTREIRKSKPKMIVWQRSFHDHIIRNERQYQKIWQYVRNNDQKWEEDCHYIECTE